MSRVVLIVLFVNCFATAGASAEPKRASTPPATIQRLVADLANRSFQTRQRANRELVRMGMNAVAPVAKAADGNDLEVTVRALSVLKQLAIGEDTRTGVAATLALERLGQSKRQTVAEHARKIHHYVIHRADTAIQALGGKIEITTDDEGRETTKVTLFNWNGRRITPLQMRALRGCRHLVLSGGTLDGDDLAFITELNQLESLDVRYTQVNDTGLRHIGRLTKLTELYLSGTRVGDAGMPHIANLTKLKTLYLSSVKLSDAGLPRLAKLSRLESLSLRATNVTDAGLRQLSELPNLKVLNLNHCERITDGAFDQLRRFRGLKYLILTGTKISDVSIDAIVAMTSLKSVSLSGTKVSDDGIKRLKKLRPKCRIR